MPTSTSHTATDILFDYCYRTCRVIRDLVAYVDGESVTLDTYDRQPIAYQVIDLIKTGDFLEEAKRWREVFADDWQRLVDERRVIKAEDKPGDWSIDELVSIYDTTNTMIRALENRLITVLLRQRQSAAR